jgi:hypothetical protein
MESCSNQKSVKQIKIHFIFEFLQNSHPFTLRHEGQSIRKISAAKTIKRYDETGFHEDHHRKGRPRVTSAAEVKLELTASEIAEFK